MPYFVLQLRHSKVIFVAGKGPVTSNTMAFDEGLYTVRPVSQVRQY